MTNQQTRLIATALVLIAGAIAGDRPLGQALVFVGLALFVIEWFRSHRS